MARHVEMIRRGLLRLAGFIALGAVFAFAAAASPASGHQSGCHRWHSCPSDTGAYVCGDLGYDTYCSGGSAETPAEPSLPHLEIQGSTEVPIGAKRTYRVWVRDSFDIYRIVRISLRAPEYDLERAEEAGGLDWAEWSDLSWRAPGIKTLRATGVDAETGFTLDGTLVVNVFDPRPKIGVSAAPESLHVGELVQVTLSIYSEDKRHRSFVDALHVRFSDRSRPASDYTDSRHYFDTGDYTFTHRWRRPGRYTIWAEADIGNAYKAGASTTVEVLPKPRPQPASLPTDGGSSAGDSGLYADSGSDSGVSPLMMLSLVFGIPIAVFGLAALFVAIGKRRRRGEKIIGPAFGWLFADPDEVRGWRKAIAYPVTFTLGLVLMASPFIAIGLIVFVLSLFPGGGDQSSPPARNDASFCSTHACIPNFPNGTGSIVQCADGTWSHSGGRPGACSHHGGVG